MKKIELGPVSTPDGALGKWRIDSFTLTESDVLLDNLRAVRDGNAYMTCRPGNYKRLLRGSTVVMSNTQMEIRTNMLGFVKAKGRVLINGLGLGMLLEAVLKKPEVKYVRVIELDDELIRLVGPTFAKSKKLEILQADAYEYKPARGERFDYAWHDIWDDINTENLPLMGKLHRRYARYVADQDSWTHWECERMRRRERAEERSLFGWLDRAAERDMKGLLKGYKA